MSTYQKNTMVRFPLRNLIEIQVIILFFLGENVLHMSVVAEDPTMVKYLLDQGIEIHEKCYGNFFCPEDQKPSRNDSLDHEEVDVCVTTNYAGYVYWGEYPLSFAGKP